MQLNDKVAARCERPCEPWRQQGSGLSGRPPKKMPVGIHRGSHDDAVVPRLGVLLVELTGCRCGVDANIRMMDARVVGAKLDSAHVTLRFAGQGQHEYAGKIWTICR